MQQSFVRFNTQDRPEFYKELRKRVNTYFKETGKSRYGNYEMVLKTVFMLALYLLPWCAMVFGWVDSFWPMIVMWILMGFGMSGIGMGVMHDANHGSYSKNPKVNYIMGFLVHLVGGSQLNWKIQHNVLHHSFTNVEGHDEDIDVNVMRFSPSQKRRGIFKFQAFYAPFLYGLMTISWLFFKDFKQLGSYADRGLLATQGQTPRKAWTFMIAQKTLYTFFTLGIPMIFVDLPWWQVFIGFLAMMYVCGLLLAMIFQPAHVLSETEFVKLAPGEQTVQDSWAIHQLKTTANFARRSVFLSWFIGGLNYQIEHHLFPNICHIHYPKLAPIVKRTAEEFGIPYHEHETFAHALRSHFRLLHQFGTGAYDRQLAQG